MKTGEPKKGGGGGMFTWGRVDDQNNYKDISEDPDDPNYNSEASFDVQTPPSFNQSPAKPLQSPRQSQILSPEFWIFSQLDLKKETREKVDQVFVEGTYSSFISWIRGLNRAKLHSFIFARTVQVALDKAEFEYDVAWELLDLLYSAKLFTSREIRRGFDILYRNIPDILTDVPNSPETILQLLAKIIGETVLSPFAVLRVPVSVMNLGRGVHVLRNVRVNDLVLADLIEGLQETKEKIKSLITEYYATGVSDGVTEFLRNNKWFGFLAVRKAVELALDRDNQEKELCSRLLAEVSGCCSPEALVEGFDDILLNIKELAIDVPDSPEIVSKFIARAIVDDSLPANYIHDSEVQENEEIEIKILLSAYYLLRPKESFTSLESVWGPQVSTLEEYKSQFQTIIQEFFDSRDQKNTEDCLKELPCKHYMHEFVKKLVEKTMDKHLNEETMTIDLLKSAEIKGLIFPDQLQQGLSRVRRNLDSLKLDVPHAGEILERIEKALAN